MKTAQFDQSDFYTLETLLHAKYRRKWYGGYEKTVPVTWSSEVVGRDGEIEQASSLMASVIDCNNFDLVKLCLSFVFWTQEGGIPSNVLDWLRRSLFLPLIYRTCNDGSKGLYEKVNNDVKSWSHWTLTAAIMYLLKYATRTSEWHHAVVRELLFKFLGADGYGNRDFVFGQHAHSRFTVPYTDTHTGKHDCGCILHPDNVMLQLVAEYNSAFARCPQVELMVSGINLGVAEALAVNKARGDLVLLLARRLGATNRSIEGVISNAQSNNIPVSIDNLLLHTDKLITRYERSTTHDSHSLYLAVSEMKSAKNWTPSACPYCWMAQNGINKSCKQHVPTQISSTLGSVLVELSNTAAVRTPSAPTPSAPAMIAVTVPTPSAPPADTSLDCAVCFTARINTRISPCGHTCCKSCADKLVLCPQCRGEIKSRDVIYI